MNGTLVTLIATVTNASKWRSKRFFGREAKEMRVTSRLSELSVYTFTLSTGRAMRMLLKHHPSLQGDLKVKTYVRVNGHSCR